MHETVLFDPSDTTERLEAFLDELADLYGHPQWALVGVHRRGDLLAERLRQRIRTQRDIDLPLGVLDITLYRDDFAPGKPQPTVRPSRIPFAIDGANVLLIDDVFSTGRTIRAALTQLSDFGRPRRVVLAVFVDRGTRELPIRPDHTGLAVDRPADEQVQLHLQELDGKDEIVTRRADG